MKRMAMVFALVGATAGPALAQNSVQLIGGLSNADHSAAVFAAALAARRGPIEIGAEGGRLVDILPSGIAAASRVISGGTVTASLPAWYGLATLRVLVPIGPIEPFVSTGAGFAHLEPQVTYVSPTINATIVFGDGRQQTKFLGTLGAGVRVAVGPASLEGGYRYFRVFQHYRPDTNFSNDEVLVTAHVIYAAIGIRF